MNELSEFFNSVAKEKKKVEEEKIRFTPRVNIDLSKDLSSFFGTVSEAKREHVIIAKRESTKLDALQGFFNRLDQFESALQENIEKQKDGEIFTYLLTLLIWLEQLFHLMELAPSQLRQLVQLYQKVLKRVLIKSQSQ